MILELYMKNCALVEELRLGIDENLNILTGETGSGKSIIIDALGLCLGEKYDRSFLRKGTEKGVVREKSTHIEVIQMISDFAVENGFEILDLDYSPIKGPEGNIEYLIHLKVTNQPFEFDSENHNKKILEVVEASHNLSK